MNPFVRTVHAPGTAQRSRRGRSDAVFVGVCVLCFAGSAAATIAGSASMSAMGELPMPGGWTMSTVWTPMCGQTWTGMAASFVGMWALMMVAMMLPSLMPMLWRYREAVGGTRIGALTGLAGAGYFGVWVAFGIAAFALGITLAALVMRLPALARVVPVAVGLVVLLAGALQFTAWKARQLECCRATPGHCRRLPADVYAAWRHGMYLGLRCCYCCAGLTMVLLVVGVMDLRAMAVVMTAITCERLAPGGERVAHVIGAVLVGSGAFLVARGVAAG